MRGTLKGMAQAQEWSRRKQAHAYGIQQKGLRIEKQNQKKSGGHMDGKEPITDPKDILDALKTIKSVEIMGYALEAEKFPVRFMNGIFHSMEILRNIHDDLVARLPPDVIAQEQAKGNPNAPKVVSPPPITPVEIIR